MDLDSFILGAVSAVGTALIPYLKLRQERMSLEASRKTQLETELEEERKSRRQCEEDVDGIRDAMRDLEESVRGKEEELSRCLVTLGSLTVENARLKAELHFHDVLGRLASDPDGQVARVFSHSRDLWLISTPDNQGTVIAALGNWKSIGIEPESMLGAGWKKILAPRSVSRASRVEAGAMAEGGRAVLWYKGKDASGRPGEYCLQWEFGRYNGSNIAVARVIAFERTKGENDVTV